MLKVSVDLGAALDQIQGMSDRVADEVRPACLEGAMLIRREVEERAPRSERAHYFYSLASGGEPHVFRRGKNAGRLGSKYLFQPGDLKKSIYIKYIEEHSADGRRAEYKIGWREHSSAKGYVPYAHMVEFGTAKSPAFPFLRPAFDAKHSQAEKIITDRILRAADGAADY